MMHALPLVGVLVCGMLILSLQGSAHAEDEAAASDEQQPLPPALGFTMKSIDGKDVPLAVYRGKVVLMVNVASKCGHTKQYAGLQAMYEKYQERGLVILGFPCNQFGGQEPGTSIEIQQFCEASYGVTFDLFEKIDVNGENAAPLYRYLTGADAPIADQGPVKWNFEKFLLDREGNVIARFRSKVTPESEEMVAAIEAALGPVDEAE